MWFHLSTKKGIKILQPKVPECALAQYENTTERRVCFSDSISRCLAALQQGEGKYYVYIPAINIDDKVYHPTVQEVRDAKWTHEVWVKDRVRVRCIGEIIVKPWDWYEYHYTGRGRIIFIHFPYKWKKTQNLIGG